MEEYLHNFSKLYWCKVNLHKDIPKERIRVIHGEYRKLYIIDVNDIGNQQDQYIDYTRIPKTVFIDNIVRFYYHYNDYLVYPYLEHKPIEEMKQETFVDLVRKNQFINFHNTMHKATLIAVLEQDDANNYIMTYHVNNKILDNIASCKRDHRQRLIYELVASQEKNNLILKNMQKLQMLMVLPPLQATLRNYNYNCLQPGINLYEYQKQDIEWMKSIEDMIDIGTNTVDFHYSIIGDLHKDKFLLVQDNLLPSQLLDSSKYNFKDTICFRGGNLISSVGLGKTIITLFHIITDPIQVDNTFIEQTTNTSCNYFYKRGPKKGTSCSKLTASTFCKTHNKSCFIDKLKLSYINEHEFHLQNYIVNDKIDTKCNLILCPTHLCDQWVREFYDKFQTKKRMVMITTKDQFDNLTLGDILFSDIIVVSYKFLTSKHYQDLTWNIKPKCSEYIKSHINEKLNSKHFKLLHLFNWHRVILDEAHEIQNMQKTLRIKNTIFDLQSKYKWNITGTPFANGLDSFLHLMSYNTSMKRHYKDVFNMFAQDLFNLKLNSNLIDNTYFLFRRNTKQSIQSEYKGTVITENINLLNFTNQERSIYNSYVEGNGNKYIDFLIRLCCHSELYHDTRVLVQNCKSLEEIQNVLLDFNHQKLQDIKKRLNNITLNIQALENELKNDDSDEHLKMEISNMKKQYTINKNAYESIERTHRYLKNSIETLNEESTCPICLDIIDKNNIAITKCGHKFCWECLYEAHQTNSMYSNRGVIKCPSCNNKMNSKDVFLWKEHNETTYDNDLSAIVAKVKSTKIGNIIHFLKDLESHDKVILFSQWDELLHKVGHELEKYNLKIVYCNGTVYQRQKAINAFKVNPDIKVIMLSSRYAASGINLTEANKIILLEPVYGAAEYRQNIENQIIGRADRINQKRPIDVYRFIIKNTIEEDIIFSRIDDNKIRQLII